MEFLRAFLRRYFAGKRPVAVALAVAASQNVFCILRLEVCMKAWSLWSVFSSSARVAKLSHTLLSLFLSKSLQLTSTVLISAYLMNANWPLGRISRGSEPNRNGYEILYCHGNHLSHCYANARHAWATRPCISQLHCNKMIPILRMLEVVK